MKKIYSALAASLLLSPMVLTAQSQQTQTVTTEQTQQSDSTLYNPYSYSTDLEKVDVKFRETRAEQRGDTLVYNASAFKVLDGSSAEDLLSKMPGIVVEGGEVQAQGEQVQKVLLDGKEFFEGDVNLAIKTLPADIISSIEVFDKASEQAEFTGFDDGDHSKALNIVTKPEFRSGQFGELYGGAGVGGLGEEEQELRYKAGGSYNFFDSKRRVSLLGMSNNINQQNFSQEDLAGVMTSSSSSGRRGKGGGNRGSGGTSTSDFMVGSMNGVTSTNAVGVNYVDEWGKKIKFTGSYFFNQSENLRTQVSEREYFDTETANYNEYYDAVMNNMNHRINGRMEYAIDEKNTIIFTPRLSFQDNNSVSWRNGLQMDDSGIGSVSDSETDTYAYNIRAELVYRRKFNKSGRTLSWSLSGTLTNNEGDTYTKYLDYLYYNGVDLSDDPTQDITAEEYQHRQTDRESYSLRSNLMYTEQLSRYMMLSLGHRFSMSNNDSSQLVYDLDTATNLYDIRDEDSSNVYESDYITNSGNVSLRFNNKVVNFNLSMDVQYATLNGVQTYPANIDPIKEGYISYLPSAFARYTIDRYNSLMFRYRSNTSNPSITDLQDVLNDTNQLYISTGNTELDQQVTHTAMMRYIHTSTAATTFIAMLSGTIYQDYTGTESYLNTSGATITKWGYDVDEGVEISRPVNLDGYYSTSAMMTYGFPFDLLRSNVNLSLTAKYTNTPTIYNDVQSDTRDLTLAPKVVIGSNISDKFDFTITYSTSFSHAISSAEYSTTDEYMTHSATAKLGWEFYKGFVFNSYLNYVGYTGIDMDDPHYYMLSASVGKKFLKNNRAEIKLEATDILKENRAFKRSVSTTYYEYETSNVMQPYYMLTFKYTFR